MEANKPKLIPGNGTVAGILSEHLRQDGQEGASAGRQPVWLRKEPGNNLERAFLAEGTAQAKARRQEMVPVRLEPKVWERWRVPEV